MTDEGHDDRAENGGSDELGEVVEGFRTAEEALRQLLDSASDFTRARDELAGARTDMAEAQTTAIERLEDARRAIREEAEAAERTLESSQQELADVTSGIFELATELRTIARDLKDTAIAYRAMDPEGLRSRVDAIDKRTGLIQVLVLVCLVATVVVFIAVLVA